MNKTTVAPGDLTLSLEKALEPFWDDLAEAATSSKTGMMAYVLEQVGLAMPRPDASLKGVARAAFIQAIDWGRLYKDVLESAE